jgi:hypothetical protein
MVQHHASGTPSCVSVCVEHAFRLMLLFCRVITCVVELVLLDSAELFITHLGSVWQLRFS